MASKEVYTQFFHSLAILPKQYVDSLFLGGREGRHFYTVAGALAAGAGGFSTWREGMKNNRWESGGNETSTRIINTAQYLLPPLPTLAKRTYRATLLSGEDAAADAARANHNPDEAHGNDEAQIFVVIVYDLAAEWKAKLRMDSKREKWTK